MAVCDLPRRAARDRAGPARRGWSPCSPTSRDPGNAGTILRTADAAGAAAVVFAGEPVDPYNGKCVRASAGSLFHVDVVREPDPLAAVGELRAAGLRTLATTGYGDTTWTLSTPPGPGPPDRVAVRLRGARPAAGRCSTPPTPSVRVPIHGRAESLNLAAAAAVCLYASAKAYHEESS